MIDRYSRMNAEVVGCVITGISELNKYNSSSEGSSFRVYKTVLEVICLVVMILTHMVTMACMMMKNIGDIRNKP